LWLFTKTGGSRKCSNCLLLQRQLKKGSQRKGSSPFRPAGPLRDARGGLFYGGLPRRSPSAPLCWVGPPPPPVTRLEGDQFHLAIAPTALVLSRLAAWRAGRRVPRPLPPSIERWATARPAVVLTQPQRGTQRLLFVGRTGGRARLAAGDRQGIGDCGWASGAAHSHLAKYRHARYREGLYSDTTASANEPLATGSLGKGPHTAHTGHTLRLWPDGNRQRTAAEGKAMVPAPRGWAICSMSGPPMCWMIQPGRDPPWAVGLEIKASRVAHYLLLKIQTRTICTERASILTRLRRPMSHSRPAASAKALTQRIPVMLCGCGLTETGNAPQRREKPWCQHHAAGPSVR